MRPHALTPIAGSVATGSVADASDFAPLEETEDLPPELRRELERQQLEAEERRVAAAAAAYKNRLADPRDKAAAQQKGSAIQNRVKDLLSTAEAREAEAPKRTAEGYGRFTGEDAPARTAPPVARKPVGISRTPTAAIANTTGPRPMVAPKPRTLLTGGRAPSASEHRPSDGPSTADEDWEVNFQKRYPSLSGLEMVETEVRPAGRVRDV
jgi:AP2-associated kinase